MRYIERQFRRHQRITPRDRSRRGRAMIINEALEPRRLFALVTWDGGGNGTDWSDALNWSTNAVPGATDDVVITVPASAPVIHVRSGTVAAIRSLQAAEPIVVGASSRLQVSTSSRSTSLTWLRDGGELRVTGGTYRVEGADAQFVVDTGTLGGGGVVLVESAATIDIAGRLAVSGVFQNHGTWTWSRGDLAMDDGAVVNAGTINIVNPSGGTFNSRVRGHGGANGFYNSGTINVASGVVAGTARDGGDVEFENNGTMNVNGGAWMLASSGDHAGRFNVNAGGALHTAVAQHFEPTSLVTGAGRMELSGEGAIQLDGAVTVATLATSADHVTLTGVNVARLELTGGRATLPGNMTFSTGLIGGGTLDGADATFVHGFDWEGGTMAGAGRTRVPITAQCRLGGAVDAVRTLSRVLDLDGATAWTAGSIDLVNGTVNVRQTFTMQPAGGPLALNNSSGSAAFNNLHLLQKNEAQHDVTFNVPLSSTGTVFANQGTLRLARGGVFQQLAASPGATISVGDTATLTAPHAMEGIFGDVRFTGGATSYGGSLANAQRIWVTGGTFTASGTLGPRLHVGGGTAVIDANATFAELAVTAGSLAGSGLITIGERFDWSGGLLDSGGPLIAGSASLARITGPGVRDVNRVLRLEGVTVWSDGTVGVGPQAHVLNTGVLAIRPDPGAGVLSIAPWSGVNGSLVNHGQLNKQLLGEARIDLRFVGTGTLIVEGGRLELAAGGIHDGASHVTATASLALRGAHLLGASGQLTGSGAVTVTGDGDFTAAGDLTFHGTLTIDGPASRATFRGERTFVKALHASNGGLAALAPGAARRLVVQQLEVQGGGAIDLAEHAMIVDHAGTSPLASIRAMLGSGYAGGAWNGAGIRSAAAAAHAGTAIGYAEASEIFTGFPATFAGEPIDDTAVVICHTLAGDANLDGRVNLADFNRLAVGFGQSGGGWCDGNFNFDDTVNLGDFNALAANFGRELGA